jgi:alpha-N-acetylglucosaminidase
MHFTRFLPLVLAGLSAGVSATGNTGIQSLVQRRLPQHADSFVFSLVNTSSSTGNSTLSRPPDQYTVLNGINGTIDMEGNSPIALASALRWYLSTYAHVDIYWYIGSRLHLAPRDLPPVNETYYGQSIVPWRYHFNPVTFSYTTAFWTWEDWELELDWLALHGVNLPLAWVGYEKILIDVFLEAGFTESDIASVLSGPAFQAWNRFGNIQGSWGGELPMSWVDSQFELQKKIVARMAELGMTPALPSFTGFVPKQIGSVYPNASFVNWSAWSVCSLPTLAHILNATDMICRASQRTTPMSPSWIPSTLYSRGYRRASSASNKQLTAMYQVRDEPAVMSKRTPLTDYGS